MVSKKTNKALAKQTFEVYILLVLIWTIAWILKTNLDSQNNWLSGSEGSFFYWTIAKIFIWLAPAFFLIRLSERKVSEVYNFMNGKGGFSGVLV